MPVLHAPHPQREAAVPGCPPRTVRRSSCLLAFLIQVLFTSSPKSVHVVGVDARHAIVDMWLGVDKEASAFEDGIHVGRSDRFNEATLDDVKEGCERHVVHECRLFIDTWPIGIVCQGTGFIGNPLGEPPGPPHRFIKSHVKESLQKLHRELGQSWIIGGHWAWFTLEKAQFRSAANTWCCFGVEASGVMPYLCLPWEHCGPKDFCRPLAPSKQRLTCRSPRWFSTPAGARDSQGW